MANICHGSASPMRFVSGIADSIQVDRISHHRKILIHSYNLLLFGTRGYIVHHVLDRTGPPPWTPITKTGKCAKHPNMPSTNATTSGRATQAKRPSLIPVLALPFPIPPSPSYSSLTTPHRPRPTRGASKSQVNPKWLVLLLLQRRPIPHPHCGPPGFLLPPHHPAHAR